MTNKARKTKSNDKRRITLAPITPNQRDYFQSIKENQITICRGLAGTGKSLLAIYAAIEAYEKGEYDRIVIVRPAIEACGEKIGYLPGGIGDKMKPLIAPIYDNIRVFIRDEGYINALTSPTLSDIPVIEVIPLAFMRGRTLNNAIVILDEAQNTTPSQMKLFLTRLGQHSKAIIEGDATQSDLDCNNGLDDIIDRGLYRIDGVGFVELTQEDIVRSNIVAKVLEFYQDD